MNCPVCNCPVKMPRRAKQHVGRCRTCKAAFRATRYEHSIQIEHLPSKNLAEAAAIAAGREEAPALWRWSFRLAAAALLTAFVYTLATEGWAALDVERRLARSGRTTTAKVYSPYVYLPGPQDSVEMTYEYQAHGKSFEGSIRSESLYAEASFEVRTQGATIRRAGEDVMPIPDERANFAGVLTVTYLPSDPGVHRIGTVPRYDLRKTKIRLAVGSLQGFVGVLLWWFSFRLGKIPQPQ